MGGFWKMPIESVKEHRDELQAKNWKLQKENEKLRERNKELEKRCNQKLKRYVRGGLQQSKIVDLEHKYNAMKSERDTLIDDLKVLREKNEKLERENKNLFLRDVDLQENVNHCLKEIVKAIEKYTTLTDHIRLKASANPGEHRYIALVNFVDRLDRGDK